MYASIVGTVNNVPGARKQGGTAISMPAGESGTIVVAIVNYDGSPFNLANCQVLLASSGLGLSRQITITDEAAGVGSCPIVIADTLGKKPSTFTYDLSVTVTDGEGNITDFFQVASSSWSVTSANGQPGQEVTAPASQIPLAQGPVGPTGPAGPTGPQGEGAAPIVISQVSPPNGVVGDSVSVTGAGFSGLAAGSVFVGSVSASFAVASDTHLTFTVPSGAQSGAVQVGNAITGSVFNVYSPTDLSLDFRASSFDPRVAVSSTGVLSIRTPAEQQLLIQPSGAPWHFAQSIDWTVRYIWDPLAADGYLFCATIDGQEWSMRTTNNSTNIQLRVRGVDDPVAGSIFGGGGGGVVPGDEVCVRWVYNSETSATNQLSCSVNGIQFTFDLRNEPTGPTISAVTAAYIGSNNGASAFGGKITFFGAAGGVDLLRAPEFVVMGDSTMAGVGPGMRPSSGLVYTPTESWTRSGIFSLAQSGHVISDQSTYWDIRGSWMTDTNLKAAVIQIGTNDLGAHEESVSTVISELQTLITHINATKPTGMKIALMEILPTATIASASLIAVNQAIMGGGATPITGVDARVSAAHDALDDGTESIKEYLSVGDTLHPNIAGRAIISRSIRDALVSLGLLP